MELGDFKGVDFSSSPLDVNNYRATDMRNLINRYGMNCKRNGWKELFSVEDDNRNRRRVNGFFSYKNYYILHAGARFFRVDRVDAEYLLTDITESSTHKPSAIDPGRLKDQRSEAYLKGERLYIVGAGDYLVYGSWNEGESYELRRVENGEDTYIPTTTININCDAESETDIKGTLDEPNLLCSKRINRLVGSSSVNSTWTLDSAIEPNSEVRVRVEFYDANGEISEKVYTNGYTQKADSSNGEAEDTVVAGDTVLYRYQSEPYEYGEEIETGGSIAFAEGKITLSFATPTAANTDNIYVTFEAKREKSPERVEVFTGSYGSRTVRLNLLPKEGSTLKIHVVYQNGTQYDYINQYTNALGNTYAVGETKLYEDKVVYASTYNDTKSPSARGTINFKTGEITFNVTTQQSSSSSSKMENNIRVTYIPSGQDEEHGVSGEESRAIKADDINSCTFGILFGAYGNTDRLFLAGNEARPNIDFYSASEDLTYFSESWTAALGSDASPIGGYARLSDSTLVIYKSNADREASIYYRTGTVREYYDDESKLYDGETVFPVTAGSIGETVVSRFACVNFSGDNLMLSRNGVFGVVLGQNLIAAERYTRERSRTVNERLCSHSNLSEAVGVVYENNYYLAVDNVCYIADARYKYKSSDDVDGSYNYEWWYWDNMPVRIWAVIDGKLYFGTDDGRVCVFDEGYTDRSYFKCFPGELGFNLSNGEITYSEGIRDSLYEGTELEFLTDGIYELYLDTRLAEIKNGRIYLSEEDILDIYDGTVLYTDNAGESGLTDGERYVICDTDVGECTFCLSDENGERVELLCGGFRLHKLISGEKLFITELTDKHFKVRGSGNSNSLIISDFAGKLPEAVTARLTHSDNVVAEWYSPILDLGTNMASKTILGMTVTAETKFGGRLKVGYQTKFSNRELTMCGGRLFSFDDLSFANLSFNTSFAESHTVRMNQRNVNYIRFRFASDDDKGCAVHKLSVLYKINKNNRGIV